MPPCVVSCTDPSFDVTVVGAGSPQPTKTATKKRQLQGTPRLENMSIGSNDEMRGERSDSLGAQKNARLKLL